MSDGVAVYSGVAVTRLGRCVDSATRRQVSAGVVQVSQVDSVITAVMDIIT